MIHIRPATSNDSDYVYKLKEQTLKEYVVKVWGWDEEFQYKLHLKRFKPENYKIIQENEHQIGCISIEEHSDKLFLSVIEIAPDFQNKGIGSSLIRNLIEKGLKENKKVELTVLKVNQRAFKLYRSLGFTIIGETETHYQLVFQIKK